jgi:GNAT superfamily N-acetyltransferase
MASELRIDPIVESEFETLLPMIGDYLRFYEVEDIDEGRNRNFFSRLIGPSDDGMLLGAWRGEQLVGYACLYWHLSSLLPAETVLLSDLFVDPSARGEGIGRALIEASAAVARERGARQLEWSTAPDNHAAQRLYDSTGAERSTWIEYELPLGRP